LCRRRHNLSFEHHKTVAKFEKDEQDSWLNKCEKNNWNLTELRKQVRHSIFENKLLPAKGKFQVIVIDPPWPYGTEYDPQIRRVASSYKEISIKELGAFVLPAHDNCIVWLWATHKFLPDAFNLLKEWGFDYKLTFVWDKEKLGVGAWLRCQAEFCLLGIKGNPEWNLTNERDVLRAARREHSRKPDEFYQMVDKLCPAEKKIDIFSREKREGWEQYGNEPAKF